MKRIALYDAESNRNKYISLRYTDFDTEDQLEIYINKLKQEQRLKNKLFKETKLKNIIEDKINHPMIYNPVPIDMDTNTMPNINNFMLDNGTGNSTVIFGSSKAGKTTLMMYLYRQFYDDNKELISTLFSGNMQNISYSHLKNLIIADGFNDKSEKYIKMHKYINMKTNNHYNFLEMFDDILDMKYSKLINNLILSYRNSNISSIICLQYIKLLSKQNRANCNNIIIFRNNTDEAIKDVIETFLKSYFLNLGLRRYDEQYNFYKEVTSDYGFFYLYPKLNRITIHRLKI